MKDVEQWGWRYDEEYDRVWNPKDEGSGPMVIEDGNFVLPVSRAKTKRGEGRGTLWTRLGPLEIEGMEIRQNTRIFYEPENQRLKAMAIDVARDGEPWIMWRIEGTDKYWRLYATQLIEMRENGELKTNQEINDEAEEILEQVRERAAEMDSQSESAGGER